MLLHLTGKEQIRRMGCSVSNPTVASFIVPRSVWWGSPFQEMKWGGPWREQDPALVKGICLSVPGGGFTTLSSQAVIELDIFHTLSNQLHLRLSEAS